jgi:PKD repeat protein
MITWATNGRTAVRTCVGAVSATLAMVAAAMVWSPPASAATARLGLSRSVQSGNPTVTFRATGSGIPSTARAYVCFGDEAPKPCDSRHAGTAVSVSGLRGAGVTLTHTYAAEGRFRASLFVLRSSRGPKLASASATLRVTIDGTARLANRAKNLTVTLNGARSTAAPGDTWWACLGDNPKCNAAAPQVHGTVTAANPPLKGVRHTYARPGTYPVSLTINGRATVGTATALVTVAAPDPTAFLTADNTTGTGSLQVIFDGSTSSVGNGDQWAFCYGDTQGCTAVNPDLSGQITSTTPTVALPTTPHTYLPGNYTATLWVTNGSTTSSATVDIAVGNPVAAPDGTCTLSGVIRSCDLYAKGNGSVAAGGSTIPFWGFTTSDGATPVLGGPTLVATEGEKLHLTLHNELDPRAGNVAVTLPSVAGTPDLGGVAPGASGDGGTFTLSRPGTYVYEAGLTPGGARQVAMGLSGVLIVRPSVTNSANSLRCAYDAAVSSTDCVANHDALNYFDREKLVVVNELDADFNADPFGSDTADYHPTDYFIDGVAYDAAKTALDPSDPAFSVALNNVRLDAAPGNSVLVRYADLGLREHALNLENLLQTETARDSQLLPAVQTQNTEFLNAGQTADAFLSIPADAVTGTRYPLFDAGLHLNNGTTGGLGGMYTYFDVVNGATAADVGPVGTAATADPVFSATAPNIDNGQVPTLDVNGTFTAQPTAGGSTPARATGPGWSRRATCRSR